MPQLNSFRRSCFHLGHAWVKLINSHNSKNVVTVMQKCLILCLRPFYTKALIGLIISAYLHF